MSESNPLPPANSDGTAQGVGGVQDFDFERETELLLLEYERALEDVMSLLDDAAMNKERNDAAEMRTMEPLVRAQVQECQLRLRVNIFFRKQSLYEYRKSKSANVPAASPQPPPEAKHSPGSNQFG